MTMSPRISRRFLLLELRLALQSRLAAGALLLLVLLGAAAVAAGLHAVAAQRHALARVAEVHAEETAALAAQYRSGGDAGMAAYSTPHLTVHPPAPLAFAALGQRDVQPAALRVRALGLQAQLYESEAVNPELAAPGRFDYAFVLAYLAPLLVLVLMHDLVSGEREAGRLRLLAAQPVGAGAPWRLRIVLRYALVLAAVLAPFAVGAAIAGAPAGPSLLVALAAALYLAFWFGVSAAVAPRFRSAAAGAAALLAVFIVLTLVTPTLVNAAIARHISLARGAELALAQRQAVHQAWDMPKQATMDRFFRTHPEWRDTTPVTDSFHWKWYYAMHQAGDDAVAGLVRQYRAGLQARDSWTARAGWLLAPVNLQVLLHRLAQTDLQAQLAYQDRIASFHRAVRQFYYPYLFNERPFGAADFSAVPRFEADIAGARASVAADGQADGPAGGTMPWTMLAALAALAALAWAGGWRTVRRITP
jgi:ABC-2 type transport system permease protein